MESKLKIKKLIIEMRNNLKSLNLISEDKS